jgi:hypothetical protein
MRLSCHHRSEFASSLLYMFLIFILKNLDIPQFCQLIRGKHFIDLPACGKIIVAYRCLEVSLIHQVLPNLLQVAFLLHEIFEFDAKNRKLCSF